MCGILGVYRRDGKPLDCALLARATRALGHRGPDDAGYLLWSGRREALRAAGDLASEGSLGLPDVEGLDGEDFDLGIGFRRLSILDPSPGGHQPMADDAGRFWLAFNGEIYNYVELRSELEAAGERFRSTSDTEVLLRAFARWGIDCLKRAVGMFAIAVFDSRRRELWLARDFFGIKPLFYSCSSEGFAFSSELRALLEMPWISRRVDPQRLFEYLRFGLTDHGDGTLFAEVRQVPAAHALRIRLDRDEPPELFRYWKLDPERREVSRDEAARRLRELFLESVSLHLRSDVPIGAALSGGIDSSAIVMAMRELQGPGLDLHTFSHVTAAPGMDEERWADLVGRAAGARMHKVRPRAKELVRELPDLIELQGEPFASTSIYAQQRVFRLARASGVKVVLDGQGADELFGGYRSYLSARLASLLRAGRLGEATRLLASVWRHPQAEGPRLLYRAGSLLIPDRLRDVARRLIGDDPMPRWLRGAWFHERGVVLDPPRPDRVPDRLRAQLSQALVHTSLPMLLRYEDRNAMASSVENRVPFLTPALVEFSLSLPEEYIIDGAGTTKSLFRQAMQGIVPAPILERPDKIGFATPEASWLKAQRVWVDEVLGSDAATAMTPLDVGVARSEWDAIMAGRGRFDFRVWRWLNAIRWGECYGVTWGD